MSEPDSEIFTVAPSALKSSEVLFCLSLIFMHILLQQVDGVDPVNCTRERKVRKFFFFATNIASGRINTCKTK